MKNYWVRKVDFAIWNDQSYYLKRPRSLINNRLINVIVQVSCYQWSNRLNWKAYHWKFKISEIPKNWKTYLILTEKWNLVFEVTDYWKIKQT